MKEEIPKISFLKKSKTQLEFEIFTISSLFSRKDKLDRGNLTKRQVDEQQRKILSGLGDHYDSHDYSASVEMIVSYRLDHLGCLTVIANGTPHSGGITIYVVNLQNPTIWPKTNIGDARCN